jgi:hypothetical protein
MRYVSIAPYSGQRVDEIAEHPIDSVSAQVTNVGRTVAGCLKFGKKIGPDGPMEALQGAWRAKRVCMYELWLYARVATWPM